MRTSRKSEVGSQKAWSLRLRERPFGLRTSVFGLLTWCLAIGLMLGSCHSGTKKTEPVKPSDESGIAVFAFSEEIHNFGSLNAGEIVSYTFTFRNTGTKTLTITNVDSGCGCTEVKIPKKSIAPGEEGQIEVIYNSDGEVGNQLKTITLYSNTEPAQKQLFIKAKVTNDLIKIYS